MRRALVMALALIPAAAVAQTRVDVRVDAVHARGSSGAEAAIGLRSVLGPYLRSEVSIAGMLFHTADPALPSPRTEAAVRFLLDPIGQQRRALSFAGGIGYVDRPYMLIAADLEGQPMGGWRPAFRVALGGGIRLGLVMRRIMPGRR